MYQENHYHSPQNHLDSQLHQMEVYRNKRHIIPDVSNRHNIKDHPDVYDVQMIKSSMLGSGYNSDRDIHIRSDVDIAHQGELKRQSILIDQFKRNSQILVDSHLKSQRGYEQYIQQLEKENHNLKHIENEILILQDRIYKLEEEQTRYMTELNILAGRSKVDPAKLDILKQRIKKLQREKLDLLDLVNMNKIKIEELHKKIHSQKIDYFPERPSLLREIEELERELSRKSVVTEERVIYKEIPRRKQEIIEEIIEQVPYEEDESRYNPDCVCRCKCDCHKKHCHGYSQRHHNIVHNDGAYFNTQHNGRYSLQTSTNNTYSQNHYKQSQQYVTPSFTKRDHNTQSLHVENSRQTYNLDGTQENFKRGRAYSQAHQYGNEHQRSRHQMSSRSRSRKRYLFEMPQERRKRFDEEKMLWDRKLNFRNYAEIYRERDQLNLFLQLIWKKLKLNFLNMNNLLKNKRVKQNNFKKRRIYVKQRLMIQEVLSIAQKKTLKKYKNKTQKHKKIYTNRLKEQKKKKKQKKQNLLINIKKKQSILSIRYMNLNKLNKKMKNQKMKSNNLNNNMKIIYKNQKIPKSMLINIRILKIIQQLLLKKKKICIKKQKT